VISFRRRDPRPGLGGPLPGAWAARRRLGGFGMAALEAVLAFLQTWGNALLVLITALYATLTYFVVRETAKLAKATRTMAEATRAMAENQGRCDLYLHYERQESGAYGAVTNRGPGVALEVQLFAPLRSGPHHLAHFRVLPADQSRPVRRAHEHLAVVLTWEDTLGHSFRQAYANHPEGAFWEPIDEPDDARVPAPSHESNDPQPDRR